ncbi:MAG: twin-arginine translocation signal domain-containing protein [Chloroflexi bacterium]|nr:twin-arginine translocation signal domain-containing protein [Chloroflexota bacterium]
MTEVTRRGFLRTASLGTAAFGILAAVPGAVFAQQQPGSVDQDDADPSPAGGGAMPVSAPALTPVETASPWLLYVRDAGRGELAILSGEQELIFTDPDLLARVQQVTS